MQPLAPPRTSPHAPTHDARPRRARARPLASLWLLSVVPLLPGVNGASALALKALAARRAATEGFGAGEFSAYANNLRALAGALAPLLYGHAYAALRRRGRNPGLAFWLAGLLGAVLPQALLHATSDAELISDQPAESAQAAAAVAPSPSTSPERSPEISWRGPPPISRRVSDEALTAAAMWTAASARSPRASDGDDEEEARPEVEEGSQGRAAKRPLPRHLSQVVEEERDSGQP